MLPRFPRAEHMMVVAGDFAIRTFEGTEQYSKPRLLLTHPRYNKSTNNADIMLIKVVRTKLFVCYSTGARLFMPWDVNQ